MHLIDYIIEYLNLSENVILAVLAVVAADVSHLGYHYKVPQTSYGVPSYQVGGSSGHYSGYGNSGHGVNYKGSEGQYLGSSFSHGDHSGPSHLTGDAQLSASTLNSGVATGFGSGSGSSFGSGLGVGYANGYGSGSNTGYSSGLSSGFSSGLGGGSGFSNGQYYQTVGGPSTVQPIYLSGSNQYQTTQYQSGEKYQQFYQVQSNEPAQVYKHFYVHSAPEEPELPKPRTPIVVPPPQKHYKIIFVKTPNAESHSSQIVPVQPQNEEKTIVYVLVKKPEEHREVIVPKVEQKPPTKPEVYFIKYNNKEDSQAVINNIVNDYNKPGQSVSYATGGSVGSPVVAGFPSSQSSGSGYISGSSGLLNVPSSTFSDIPSYPSGGFSNGYSKYPSSSTGSSFTSGSSDTLFNKFGSSIGSNSGLSSGISSGLSNGISSGLSSGSGLSSLISSSQSDSSVQAPILSSSVSAQSFGVNDSGSDAGAEASSLFGGVSAPSISTTSGHDDLHTVSASQGLPHETYGVPKFRIE
ncbi:Cuticular protein PpolCPT1 [Operophtera brumata]|uniref:Cuticular protein PpolCPT1 n=1 Tax=Operophtera brumata TaxID=104452 RepID=A0A0L7KX75_OPEBR|nr:Cuticular protein PpolCPT1 [Operophtera brumata]